MTYTDDILQTYLNGSLDAETATALEQAVEGDEKLEERLMALDPFAAPIKDVFADIPPLSRIAEFTQTIQRPQTTFAPWLRYAAAALLGVVIGYGAFEMQPNQGPLLSDWRDQVAAYQVLYVTETVESISSSPEDLTKQFAVANAQLGINLQQAVLSQIPSLELKRAQILGFKDSPLIQIAFAGTDGTPIALCVVRNENGPGDLETETLAGLASASWSTDTHSFLLIGGNQQDAITQTASQLYDVF